MFRALLMLWKYQIMLLMEELLHRRIERALRRVSSQIERNRKIITRINEMYRLIHGGGDDQ